LSFSEILSYYDTIEFENKKIILTVIQKKLDIFLCAQINELLTYKKIINYGEEKKKYIESDCS